MKKTAERQVVLPWAQVVKIAFNAMRVRFFRSLITTLTLALAIAFVAYIRSGHEILNALWPYASQDLQDAVLRSGYELSGGKFGTGPKDLWLAILSLTVCVVGIVNAQLMAVTERFREIGTYKCLGALNSFVVRIFVLEAIYQGIMGGTAGAVMGVFISTITMAMKFGWTVMLHWPIVPILLTLTGSTLLAVFLSFLGVLYPALIAARMHPAVALRTDQ